MSLNLPKIYPITDTQLSGLSHAEQVARLIDGGATLIQLRDKHASPREFYREAAAAFEIARAHHVRLIINDRVDIALALKADGVHLGQTDLPVTAARRLLGKNSIIGFSTHNIAQAQLAAALPIDYLAFGPIFPTSTKEEPDPVAGVAVLPKIRAVVGSLPLVGIGGIGPSTVLEVLSAGADAVSIISTLVADSTRIAENLRKMLDLTQSAPSIAHHR